MLHTFHAFPWSNLLSINRRKCSFNIIYEPDYKVSSHITLSFRSSGQVNEEKVPFTEEDRDKIYRWVNKDFHYLGFDPLTDDDIQILKEKRCRIPASCWKYHSSLKLN